MTDARPCDWLERAGVREDLGITAPGTFTFSRAVCEWCFVQLPLIELGGLRTALKARGLSDFGLFALDPWETLDREDVLVPVGYARHGFWNHNLIACLEDGDLRVREESGHIPWDKLRAEAEEVHGDDANLRVLYHHWQILAVAELQDQLTPGYEARLSLPPPLSERRVCLSETANRGARHDFRRHPLGRRRDRCGLCRPVRHPSPA